MRQFGEAVVKFWHLLKRIMDLPVFTSCNEKYGISENYPYRGH